MRKIIISTLLLDAIIAVVLIASMVPFMVPASMGLSSSHVLSESGAILFASKEEIVR